MDRGQERRGVTQAAPQYLDDDVVRHLAAATLLQAWNDALGEDEEEALAAQEWLIMHPWAEALCDCCDVDRGRLVGKLEDALK